MNLASDNPQADLAYQKAILKSVSRTFALTIPLLPPVLEKVVGNTYLLCRIVDTIEDAADLSPETKRDLSNLFLDAVLENAPVDSFVAPCLQALKNYSNQDELDLIRNTPTVMRILRTCSSHDQAAVSRCVSIMSKGMSYFHDRQTKAGLKDLVEFEEYCYVVAGVVGELLTSIFRHYSSQFSNNIQGHENLAVSFGQALQMTNILKDSSEDQARGVSWKPANSSQLELLQIAYEKLKDSLSYILLIPRVEVGMRRFCLLAFGLAVLTLDKILVQHYTHKKGQLKLSKMTVWLFYGFTRIAASNNALIKAFFYLWSSSLRRLALQ